MDEKRPKRRKDKYNPYTLTEKEDKHFLSFRDGQDVLRELQITKELFEAITTNCAVLGVAILVIQKDFSLIQSVVYAFSTALGFALALGTSTAAYPVCKSQKEGIAA